MCEKHTYTYNSASTGLPKKTIITEHCQRATQRHKACETPQSFMHRNERPPRASKPRVSSSTLPPSPPSSNASFPGSGSDNERPHIYVNGERVVDMSGKSSHRERRNSKRVVIVEPAGLRTPPRYETPIGSPSRSSPTYVSEPRLAPRSRDYYEPRSEVRVHGGDSHQPHRAPFYRHVPNSSRPRRESTYQQRAGFLDEDSKVHKLERDLRKAKEAREAARQVQSEIDRANESIAKRPAVPVAPKPPRYRRGSVSITQTADVLVEPLRQVHIHDPMYDAQQGRWQRDKQRAVEEEEEAQRERLRARMTPQHRRSSVVYDRRPF